MLSILVPVYNQEIVALAATLVDACKKAEVRYEILFGEDGSSAEWIDTNSSVKQLDSVEHLVFKDNRGRSAIRNTLASLAKFECLLFLDADSQLTGSSFIADYLKLQDRYPVISGGRVYTAHPPQDKLLRLHWKYGSSRNQNLQGLATHSPINPFIPTTLLFVVKSYVTIRSMKKSANMDMRIRYGRCHFSAQA
ncbi:MAG: glycosyltransferase [Saprospiraceae bacterium]